MEEKATKLQIARRLIPWFLVNFFVLPTAYGLIYIGWGRDVASDFAYKVMS